MYKKIKFIDLFCGAGGWSEGMSQQGLQCIYSVDNWKPACVAHSLNHPGIPDDDQPKDILSQEVFAKLKEIVKEHIEKDEDLIIIGSPPCTQFSFSNKAGNGNIVQGMVLVRRFLELIDFVQ